MKWWLDWNVLQLFSLVFCGYSTRTILIKTFLLKVGVFIFIRNHLKLMTLNTIMTRVTTSVSTQLFLTLLLLSNGFATSNAFTDFIDLINESFFFLYSHCGNYLLFLQRIIVCLIMIHEFFLFLFSNRKKCCLDVIMKHRMRALLAFSDTTACTLRAGNRAIIVGLHIIIKLSKTIFCYWILAGFIYNDSWCILYWLIFIRIFDVWWFLVACLLMIKMLRLRCLWTWIIIKTGLLLMLIVFGYHTTVNIDSLSSMMTSWPRLRWRLVSRGIPCSLRERLHYPLCLGSFCCRKFILDKTDHLFIIDLLRKRWWRIMTILLVRRVWWLL